MSRPNAMTLSALIFPEFSSLPRAFLHLINPSTHTHQGLIWPKAQSWPLHFTVESGARCTCLPAQLYTSKCNGPMPVSRLRSSLVARCSVYWPPWHPHSAQVASQHQPCAASSTRPPLADWTRCRVQPHPGSSRERFLPEVPAPFSPADH